jgi:molybdopterin-binding protein
MISARNQFKGIIKSVKLGDIMAEVVIKSGTIDLVSVITRESAETMGLAVGKEVTAIVKSTEVMVSAESL